MLTGGAIFGGLVGATVAYVLGYRRGRKEGMTAAMHTLAAKLPLKGTHHATTDRDSQSHSR